MILIDTLHINNSGGKILLEYLIENLLELNKNEDFIFIIDERLETKLVNNFEFVYIVKNTFRCRRRAYKKLFHKYIIHKVFCFNNLPPPFKIYSCPVYIYFHNVLLLDQNNINTSTLNKIYHHLKKLYLIIYNNKEYNWIVQTELVSKLLQKKINIKLNKISVIPFFSFTKSNLISRTKKYKFLYVADGSRHKNHEFLFQVLQELANKYNAYPALLLTIDINKFPKITNRINELKKNGINITNYGLLRKEDLMKLYNEVEFCIYPSKCESFGLPLIEAALHDCKIIAIDLEYVKQVIIPSYLFPCADTNYLVHLLYQILNKEIILQKSIVIVENKITKLIKLLQNV